MLILKNVFKKIIISVFGIFLFIIFTTLIIDFLVSFNTMDNIYDSISKIPKNKVGLVLGTSKYWRKKRINLYYKYRISAAYNLYKHGKVEFIIVSGDNSRKRYNEPAIMKRDLIRRGIPSNKIYLDYAGFRTYDSIVRVKKVFGLSKITIISQKFHIERAIFIAERIGIKAIGYPAKNLNPKYGKLVLIREKLARVKMLIDLLTEKQPKFLGKKIIIK